MAKNVSSWRWVAVLVVAAGCGRTGLADPGRASSVETAAAGTSAGPPGDGGRGATGGKNDRPGAAGSGSEAGARGEAGGSTETSAAGGSTETSAAGGSTEPSSTGGSPGEPSAVCQLVERYLVPPDPGGATDPFPTDLGAIDSGLDAPPDDELPPVPGHHVLLRRGARSRHSPALATSGSVLGVAFVEGTTVRFGVSSQKAHAASSFTFRDIAEVPDAKTLELLLAGDEQGFHLGWLADGGNSWAQVVSVRLDRRGRIEQGPWQLASSELSCAVSSAADTLAVACSEGQTDETWVELCPPDDHCVRCSLGEAETSSVPRPAITWDGNAFDVVFAGHTWDSSFLALARITASGEEILPPVPLDGFHTEMAEEPAIAFDGENLAVVYGGELRVFDLSGRLVRGPWALQRTGTESQVVSTSTGHAVLHDTELAETYVAVAWIGEGGVSSSTLLTPSSSVGPVLARARAAIARADDAVFTVHEVRNGSGAGSSLVLARFDEVEGTLDRDPELLVPGSSALQPIAVRCETSACYVLADEPWAGIGYPQQSYGVWQVDRETDAVTPPPAEATARGLAAAAPAIGTAGTATVLLQPGSDDGPYLALWGYDDSLSTTACPDGYYQTGASLFFEEEALRVFYGSAEDSTSLDETLFSDGRFRSPSVVGAQGVQARCGADYYAVMNQDPGTVLRWRPEEQPAFSPAFVLTGSTAPDGLCCNDRLLAVQGSVLTLEGGYVASPDLMHRGCASAGDSLLLVAPWPYANGLLLVRVTPGGELSRWRLTLPDGVQGPGPNTLASGAVTVPELPWALSSNRDQVLLAWYDPDWGDAFLSTWRLR
jgi:hypothetical protein